MRIKNSSYKSKSKCDGLDNLKFLLTRKDLNLGYTEITRRHFGTNLVSLRSD